MPSSPKAPLLTVAIPVYNGEEFLAEALESVLGQTGDETEVLVIDDGSHDGSAAVAQRYAPRVRVISQPNGGLAAARNRGHLEARGQFVAWFDHDDVCEPHRFAVQLDVLRRFPELDLVCTDFSAFDESGVLATSYATQYYGKLAQGLDTLFPDKAEFRSDAVPGISFPLYRGTVYRWLAFGNFVHPPTVMMRADLWQKAGPLKPGLSAGTDWEFLVRASRLTPFGYIARPLLRYRRSPGQSTADANMLRNVPGEMRAFGEILAADTGLQQWPEEIRMLYRHWHLTRAEGSVPDDRIEAFRHLARSLSYGFDARRFLLTAGRAVAPAQLLPTLGRARRWLRRVRAPR